MRTIWKFPLPTATQADSHVVEMPRGAIVVRFASQFGTPTLWADVDDQEPLERRRFDTVGTGHPVDSAAHYVGSYEQGPFVWHVLDMQHVVALPDSVQAMPLEAQNAYRLLIRAGFTAKWEQPHTTPVWHAPGPDPLTTEQMMAVAELQEHGFGPVVSA